MIAKTLCLVLYFSLLTAPNAFADVDGITNNTAVQAMTALTPTAEDYATAKSELPLVDSLPTSAFDNNVPQAVPMEVVGANGHAPRVKYKGKVEKLFEPTLFPQLQEAQVAPQSVGTGGIQFTSSSVFPQAADITYPISPTGKLWYTKPDGSWWVCSGSMVKPGIVVTAGHCVHSGNDSSTGWYSNFTFVPAHRSGSAPYGTWSNWAFANTTSPWYSGGGGVPNAADYAIVVFNKNDSGYRIGDYTGWLGWQYPNMIGRHVTAIGYPGNLDSGNINHRVDSNVNQGSKNTGLYGSDMGGGSSGGGIVLNLRQDYTGVPIGWEHNPNRLVSVVSYGYDDPAVMVQGGSQFDSRFQTLLNNTCATYAWAC